MSKTILYYPTIDIPNRTWVKNNLLYWDVISSIVPYRGYSGMSDYLDELGQYGCYKPVYPEEIFDKFNDDFYDVLEHRLWELPRLDFNFTYINENKLFYMHGLEIMERYPEIKRLFERSVLVGGEWIRLGKNAATAYMKTLAEFAIKGDFDANIGTDNSANALCLKNGFGSDIDANSYFEFVFNNCVPMPSEEASFTDILNFKKAYGRQLVDFQSELSNLRQNLSNCLNERDVMEVFYIFKQKTTDAINTAEISLKEHSIDLIKGSLKSAFNSLLPSTEFFLGCAMNAADLTSYFENALNPTNLMFGAVGAVGAAGLHIVSVKIPELIKTYKMGKSNFAYIMHAHKSGMYRTKK